MRNPKIIYAPLSLDKLTTMNIIKKKLTYYYYYYYEFILIDTFFDKISRLPEKCNNVFIDNIAYYFKQWT